MPARAICASCSEVTPDAAIAPTTWPSTTIGRPPSTITPPLARANEASTAPAAYVSLVPPLVGNYAPGSKKLKYYKADIALRVGNDNKAKVEMHEPLIRDQLILLFAQKTEEEFATTEGKEAIRQDALQRVQQVLLQEEGLPLVEDLLFNNLVVQR